MKKKQKILICSLQPAPEVQSQQQRRAVRAFFWLGAVSLTSSVVGTAARQEKIKKIKVHKINEKGNETEVQRLWAWFILLDIARSRLGFSLRIRRVTKFPSFPLPLKFTLNNPEVAGFQKKIQGLYWHWIKKETFFAQWNCKFLVWFAIDISQEAPGRITSNTVALISNLVFAVGSRSGLSSTATSENENENQDGL